MFKKILVPLDGSELAAKILPNVVDMAKCADAEVTLLHVCYFPLAADMESLPPKMEKEGEVQEARECALFLGRIAEQLQAQGVKVIHKCIEGLPAREIISYAHENNMDLISMATHGRGEVAWVLGSTAEKVVTHATVPTLLYRVVETKVPELKGEVFGMP